MMEDIIKEIIRKNWVSHWGNSMGSDDRDDLERRTLQMLKEVQPIPASIIIHALIQAATKGTRG
jgi:hypothetical protein